jgi:hypothetical protein
MVSICYFKWIQPFFVLYIISFESTFLLRHAQKKGNRIYFTVIVITIPGCTSQNTGYMPGFVKACSNVLPVVVNAV